MVGFLTFQSSSQTIEESTRKHLIYISILRESEFERWLSDSQKQLESLAQRPLVREYTSILGSTATDESTFQSYQSKIIQDHFTPNLDYEGGYNILSIIRASDGLILASTTKSKENKYRENRKFFIEGKKHPYIDDVRYDLTTEEAVMHISTPIYGETGRVIAVLAGHLDLRKMSLIMSEGTELTSSEETYLVNSFNFFVTESRFFPEAMLIKTAYSDGIEKCLSGEDVFGEFFDYRGVPVVGYYKWIPERSMCIATEVDWGEAYQPISALKTCYYRAGIIAFIAAIISSIIISASIANPIQDLEK